MKYFRDNLWLIPLFALLLSAAFFSSGLELEADNLKYMGIAWQMQDTGHYLIPMANGEFYTDKPPLLFWMMTLFWRIFGMNPLSLQIMVVIIMAVWIILTQLTFAAIFPEDNKGQALLPYIMLGCFSFFDYAHFIHVDLFLVTGVLFANLGIFQRINARSVSQKRTSLYIMLGVFIGLFSKGPVVYIFTFLPFLIVALFFPVYRQYLRRIILEVLLSTLLVIVLWVLPVMLQASHEFIQQILYGQIARRAVQHGDKTYLFYAVKLPYMLLPWTIGLIFFKKFSVTIKEIYQKHIFILMIILTGLLVLTFFGQKRFWYLLPCIPYALIVLTRFFAHASHIRWLKVSGFFIALLYFVSSTYFFHTLNQKNHLSEVSVLLNNAKQKGIVIFSEMGTIYAFNYFAKMSVITTIHDLKTMEEWLSQHPQGVVIANTSHCPGSTHSILHVSSLGYSLCRQ